MDTMLSGTKEASDFVAALMQEGLSVKDIRFVVDNKFAAQQVAAGITELLHEVRACLRDLKEEGPSYGFHSRKLLLGGQLPSSKGEYLLLRLAKGCLKVAAKNPEKKISQKDVAGELRITQQRMSQLVTDLKKSQNIEFPQLLERLEI